MAEVDVHAPRASIPGSYFDSEHIAFRESHTTLDSIYKPPAPSPRPKTLQTPSYNRSRSTRSISSIPRPVSRSNNDGGNLRKRPKLESQHWSSKSSVPSAVSTPHVESPGSRQPFRFCGLDGESEYDLSYFSVPDSAHSRDAVSPLPFVNTSYELAGGLDTPGISFEKRQEEWGDQEAELDWRVNRYTKSGLSSDCNMTEKSLRARDTLPRTPSSISGHGQKRSLDDSPQFETPRESYNPTDVAYTASGWHIRSRAWAITGGLAFKAINFCWNTAFRGFSAGGGQSFTMDVGTPEVPQQGFRVSQLAATDDVFSNQYEKSDEVPGGFPEEGFIDNYMNKFKSDASTPTLRGHGGDTGHELKNDWLLVEKPGVSRRKSRASIAGSRSSSFRHTTTSRSNGATTSGASFASPRSRPSLSHHRRTSSNTARLSPERSRPSLPTNPSYQKDLSTLPDPVSPVRRISIQAQSASAMSPEVIKFEKRMKKKARQDDESMSRMNAHLKDLIRQGKEALGSKISIEDDGQNLSDESSDEDDDRYHRRTGRQQGW